MMGQRQVKGMRYFGTCLIGSHIKDHGSVVVALPRHA